MISIVNEEPDGRNSNYFIEIIMNQNIIEDIDSYTDYSNDHLFNDICSILNNAQYLNEESVLKKV